MNDQEWDALVQRLNDLDGGVEAASRLQSGATLEDVPRLLALLGDESFVVREAAAWPLSDLGVVSALPQLLEAVARGSAEGLDNDGLMAAITDLVSAHPGPAAEILESIEESEEEQLRPLASWALEFCRTNRDV